MDVSFSVILVAFIQEKRSDGNYVCNVIKANNMLKLEELQSFPCFMKLNDKLCYDWNLYMEDIDVCRFS